MVIFVKISCTKGLNAAGLLLLTLQILVYLFEYIVNVADIIMFMVDTWAGLLGYILFVILFIKSRLDAELVLTIIGILLWGSQFSTTFASSGKEIMVNFLYCSPGILGVCLIIIGIVVYLETEKRNKERERYK